MAIPVGVMPRDVDTLFIRQAQSLVDLYYLVEEGTPEAEWVASYLPSDHIVSYQMSQPITKPSYLLHCSKTLDDIFLFSNLADVLRSHKIEHLLMIKMSAAMQNWAEKTGVSIISVPFSTRKVLEDKIAFDTWLASHALPKPASWHTTLQELSSWKLPAQSVVVQTTQSAGAEGTYIVHTQAELSRVCEHLSKTSTASIPLLVREYTVGTVLGVSALIYPEYIATSGYRIQCYDKQAWNGQDIYTGITWVTQLSEQARSSLAGWVDQLTTKLWADGYYGLLNFDCILAPDNSVYFLECNARYSAATIHTILFPPLMGGKHTNDELLIHVLSSQAQSASSPEMPLYISGREASFAGSSLVINTYPSPDNQAQPVTHQHPLGMYRHKKSGEIEYLTPDIRKYEQYLEEDIFFYMCDAQRGEVYAEYTTLAYIVSNYPLFTDDGSINQAGKRLKEYFTLW